MSQYKHYLKKPRGEIVKDICSWFVAGGVIALAASSPIFWSKILQDYSKKKYNKQSVVNAFHRLHKAGMLRIEKHNHQTFLSLTEEGRKRAGYFQINDLTIRRPKKWDAKWRIVIFDIADRQRIKREALRGFLKRLEFYKLQQSVWIHPFDCSDEIKLLRDFFGFTVKEIELMIVETLENDESLRKHFQLK